MSVVVVGLDASPRRIGWAVLDYETSGPLDVGVAVTVAEDDLVNRRAAVQDIARVANRLGDVLAVLVEDAYAGPNRRVTIDHASAVGNVEAFALERWPRILVARIAASSWRSVLGIDAKGKDAVRAWAIDIDEWLTDEPQDAIDAVAIAAAGITLIDDGGIRSSGRNITLPNSPEGKEADR